jgi:hypothetical protein
MERNMKQFYTLVGIILFFYTFYVFPTSINGRLTVTATENSKLTVLLQINTNTGTDDIGGATIVFGFDTSAISFPNNPVKNVDYIFHNFDGGQYSAATVTRPSKNRIWINIDLPLINSNNGTPVAGSPGWSDVVTLNFNVVNQNITPSLYWYLTSMFWGIYDADNMTLWETGVFEGNFGLVVEINNGWNMVSVPGINPYGQGVNNWWPHKTGTVWGFNGVQYVSKTITTPGEGYWMKNTVAETYDYPAIQIVAHDPIEATAGWNMIGGYENSPLITNLTTNPPGQKTGIVWGFNEVQYIAATNLVPGYGYWIKVLSACQINIPGGFAKESEDVVEYFREDWGKITITDDLKRNYTLYLVNGDIDLSLYELPPIPPEGLFDIRFGTGRIVENINNGTQTIVMRGIVYPIKVEVENMNISLLNESGTRICTDFSPGNVITISDNSIDKLLVIADKIITPTKFYLQQNYPNPFNPTTKIKFAIPKETNVHLGIYNILGELVTTLVNMQLKPGNYEYEFNASDLSSGIYIYRIQADDFVETKKMVLIK